MLKTVNDWVERLVFWALSALFAGLIVTVATQVFARNVLEIGVIWTLDLAQLLFAWCIFLGAAVALRRGGQYVLHLFPDTWRTVNAAIGLFAFLASLAVVWVMIDAGLTIIERFGRRTNQALGISEGWFYAAIPVGAAVSGLFLLEQGWNRVVSLLGRGGTDGVGR